MKIDKDTIIHFLRALPGKIKTGFRTVYSLPHSGKYFVFALIMIPVFLVITFPYDYLIKRKIYNLEGKVLRTVDINGFDFSLFRETYIKDIFIVTKNGDEISCKSSILNVSLNPLNVFFKKRLKSDFQFDMLKYAAGSFEILLNVNGNLDMQFDEKTGDPLDGNIKVLLSDSMVALNDLKIPGPMGPIPLNIESVSIQNGNIEAIVTNGVLRLNAFKISGNDISADITGTVSLNAGSRLDLVVSIDSESTLLDQYRDMLGSFIKNEKISIRVRGSMKNPEISMADSGVNEN